MISIFTLLILPLLLPLQAGIMARSFGRNFWFWFCMTLPLPVISNYILLCLGDRLETASRESEVKSDRRGTSKKTEQFGRKPIPLTANA